MNYSQGQPLIFNVYGSKLIGEFVRYNEEEEVVTIRVTRGDDIFEEGKDAIVHETFLVRP